MSASASNDALRAMLDDAMASLVADIKLEGTGEGEIAGVAVILSASITTPDAADPNATDAYFILLASFFAQSAFSKS